MGDSVVVGIVGKSKLLDFPTMLVFWSLVSLVRNSVVLAVYLLFSVACFFTVHEHWYTHYLNKRRYMSLGLTAHYDYIQPTKYEEGENQRYPYCDYRHDGKNLICKISDAMMTLAPLSGIIVMVLVMTLFIGKKSRESAASGPARTNQTLEKIRSVDKHFSI